MVSTVDMTTATTAATATRVGVGGGVLPEGYYEGEEETYYDEDEEGGFFGSLFGYIAGRDRVRRR